MFMSTKRAGRSQPETKHHPAAVSRSAQIYASTHGETSSSCSVESREMLNIVRWLLIFMWTLHIHAVCSAVSSTNKAPQQSTCLHVTRPPASSAHLYAHLFSSGQALALILKVQQLRCRSGSCAELSASSSDCRMRDVLEIKSTSCPAVFINESMKTRARETGLEAPAEWMFASWFQKQTRLWSLH